MSVISTLDFEVVKESVHNYLDKGDMRIFFDPYGNFIKGYSFSRQELHELLGTNKASYLFLILGRDTHGETGKLELFLTRVSNFKIDTDSVLQSQMSPITLPVSSNGNLKGYKTSHDPTVQNQLLFNIIEEGNINPLLTSDKRKLKGFNFLREHLDFIGLSDELTQENAYDSFAFIPVLKQKSDCNAKDQLNFALVQLENGVIHNKFIGYALPCPSACNDLCKLLKE